MPWLQLAFHVSGCLHPLQKRVHPNGSRIRGVELPGSEPTRVYIHGLGASSAPYYLPALTHPALFGHRSLLLDMLGFGLSDRPADVGYTLEEHADFIAEALVSAGAQNADVIGHSMGGAVAIVLASRHPDLVRRLVLVDANLDPVPIPTVKRPGSSGIAVYASEAEFLDHGWSETMDFVGPNWAATMRQAGPEALYRSAMNLMRGTTPTMRVPFETLSIPRTFLYPAANGGVTGQEHLAESGVAVVPIADCGHNIMLDNPGGFATAVATALS